MPYFTDVALSPDGELIVAGCEFYYLPARRAAAQRPWWWIRGVRMWRNTAGTLQVLDVVRCYTGVAHVALSTGDCSRRVIDWVCGHVPNGMALWDMRGSSSNAAAASSDGGLVARGTGCREDNHGSYVDTAVEIYDAGLASCCQ